MIFQTVAIEYRTEHGCTFYKVVYRQKLGHMVFRSKMNSFIPPSTDVVVETNGKPEWVPLLKDATLRYYYFDTMQSVVAAIEELKGE